jgi:hypothetical protein
MSQQSAVVYLHSKLDEQAHTVSEHLTRGGVKDYAEYQRLCGVIQGLNHAKQIIDDLAKRLEEGADE